MFQHTKMQNSFSVRAWQNISQIKSFSAVSSYKVTFFNMKHESKSQFQQIPKSNQIFTTDISSCLLITDEINQRLLNFC